MKLGSFIKSNVTCLTLFLDSSNLYLPLDLKLTIVKLRFGLFYKVVCCVVVIVCTTRLVVVCTTNFVVVCTTFPHGPDQFHLFRLHQHLYNIPLTVVYGVL